MEEHRRWVRMLVPALLVGTAAVLMVARLGSPARIFFDEVYYVNDARDFLEFGVEDGFVVHPPLGKLVIAASIRIFGDTPFGWRALGGAAAVATVLLVYLIGRRLFRRMAPAAFAAFLLTVDGVFIVQARTAMLDIYLAFFVVLGAWALVVDQQRVRAADAAMLAADPDLVVDDLPRRDRRYLALAGVAFGLAIAVKWSGVLALGAAGLTTIAFELGRRKRLTGRFLRQPWRGVGILAGLLVAVPLAVYVATWTPWMVSFEHTYTAGQVCGEDENCAVAFPSRVAGLARYHQSIAEFHNDLEAEHSYRAAAYTWPVQARPVVYYYETCSDERLRREPQTNDDGEVEIPEPCAVEQGQAAEMLAVGNPAVWWPFLPAGLVLVAGVIRRDRRAGLPLMFALAQFLPWLLVSRPVFSFYAVPIVPFVALGVAAAVARIGDRAPIGVPLGVGAAGAAVGTFVVWIYDVLGGAPTRAVYGLTAAGVAAAAAAAAALVQVDDPPASPRMGAAGRWALLVLTVLAGALAIFFVPVWLGIPMDESVIKLRWWFRGWI